MLACSSAHARPCSNVAIGTSIKKHVATHVATTKHTQDAQEYVMDNHKKEEPNQTHGEHGENLLVRLPPSVLTLLRLAI